MPSPQHYLLAPSRSSNALSPSLIYPFSLIYREAGKEKEGGAIHVGEAGFFRHTHTQRHEVGVVSLVTIGTALGLLTSRGRGKTESEPRRKEVSKVREQAVPRGLCSV